MPRPATAADYWRLCGALGCRGAVARQQLDALLRACLPRRAPSADAVRLEHWRVEPARLEALCWLADALPRSRQVGIVIALAGPALTARQLRPAWPTFPRYVTPQGPGALRFDNFAAQLCALGPAGRVREKVRLWAYGRYLTLHGERYADNIKGLVTALPAHAARAVQWARRDGPEGRRELAACFAAACGDGVLEALQAFLAARAAPADHEVIDLADAQDTNAKCGEYLRSFRLACLRRFRADHSGCRGMSQQQIEANPRFGENYLNEATFGAFLRRMNFAEAASDPQLAALIAYQRDVLSAL